MSQTPTRDDWVDAPFRVWIGPNEAIHYDSIFQKRWTGSWERLMRCIENNMYSSGLINWPAVQDNYQAMEDKDE